MATGDVLDAMGFDAGLFAEEAINSTTTGGTITETSTGARTGTALRIQRTSAASCVVNRTTSTTPAFVTGKSAGCLVFYLKFNTLPSANITVAYVPVFGGNDAEILVSNTGALTAKYTGGTATATVATLTTGTWYRVELRLNQPATTHTGNISVDGGTELSFTSGGGVSPIQFDGWEFGTFGTTASTYDMLVDDMVFYEGNARPNTAHAVRVLTPNGDVDANWTITGAAGSRWGSVDERPSDTTTTYISSTTASQVQRLDFDTYTISGTEVIKAVIPAGNLGSTGTTGTRNAVVTLQNGSGTDHATTATWSASINGWRVSNAAPVYILAPASAIWSQSELDGIRLKLTKSATTDEVRLGNVWLYVVIQGDASSAVSIQGTTQGTGTLSGQLTEGIKGSIGGTGTHSATIFANLLQAALTGLGTLSAPAPAEILPDLHAVPLAGTSVWGGTLVDVPDPLAGDYVGGAVLVGSLSYVGQFPNPPNAGIKNPRVRRRRYMRRWF